MLRTLDPHSNFLDPEEYRLLQQNQRGQYYGVGMEVMMDGPQVVGGAGVSGFAGGARRACGAAM